MKGLICRRLQRFATRSVVGVASVAVASGFASYVVLPEKFLPEQTASKVSLAAAFIDNSNNTIGIADSNLWGLFNADLTPNTAAIDRHLDALESLGVDTVRILIPWNGVQPAPPGTYVPEHEALFWRYTDYVVNEAADRDIAILAVLNSTPPWGAAGGQDNWVGPGTEPDVAKFAAYAGAVADRYDGLVSAYEIWNEPNAYPYWAPQPDPAAYTRILKAAYSAINAEDPEALVVAGVLGAITSDEQGYAMDARTFVEAMYANGAKGYFDALSFHPYQYTTPFSEGAYSEEKPWNADSPLEMLIAIRQTMIENGDTAKRIWATEYGLHTSGPGAVTPQHQADYIADFLSSWDDYSFTGPAFIYSLLDTGDGTENGSFGVFYANGAEKPAADVIRAALSGEDPIEDVVNAISEQLAAATAQAYADALAKAYADALAKALADAWAAALAAAFGVAPEAAATPLVAAATEVPVAAEVTLAEETMPADVTAEVKVTNRVQAPAVAEAPAGAATAVDVTPGALQPAVEASPRHLVASRKPADGGVAPGDGTPSNTGGRGTTGATGRNAQSLRGGTTSASTGDLKANDGSATSTSGATGSKGSRDAA